MVPDSEAHVPEFLHAYWRMEYIVDEEGRRRGNPFVELPLLGDDRKALIVYRGESAYLVLNRYPYNPGHLLAIPYREVPELEELEVAERAELMDLIVLGQQALRKAMRPDGFNVGFNFGKMAGAGIPSHLHAHIVPRWNGDTNFMPVLGRTRVLPEALDATWEKLRKEFPGG